VSELHNVMQVMSRRSLVTAEMHFPFYKMARHLL